MQLVVIIFVAFIQLLAAIGDITISICNYAFFVIKQTLLLFVSIPQVFARNIHTTIKSVFRAPMVTFSLKRSLPPHADIYVAKPYRAKVTQRSQRVRTSLFPSFLHKIRIPLRGLPSNPQSKKQTQHSRKEKPRTRRKRAPLASFYPTPLFTKVRFFIAGIFFSLLVVFIPLLTLVFLQELPNPKTLASEQSALTTKIYDRNGILLDQVYASQNRTRVHLTDIPLTLQQATIAIEDKDFYKHPGFDISAIIRSALVNASGGEFQGGSTITQQLIKSSLLSPETTLQRKVKEVVLAFWAERIYTKKQILEMYFNQIPYGGTAWGAQAASQLYFGKDVKDLTLAQAAFLAGIPQAPTTYSPYSATANAWKKRQHEVLDRMATLGYITKAQAKKAKAETLTFQKQQIPLRAPHFVQYVKNLLVTKYGLAAVERGGLVVKTSLDTKTQEMAQRIVADEVTNSQSLGISNGAALITNPKNGDVLAMVGSRDFNESTFGNVNITTSRRQPGSSIKVVTYAQALTQGYTAATIIDDSPVSYPIAGQAPYSPVNYDGRFHGRIPLRMALANSFNIPAVKTLDTIGIANMVNLAKQMGISTWGQPQQYGLSLTLGAAEVLMVDMGEAYGTFANQGVHVALNPILKVTDGKGDVLEEKTTIYGNRVLSEGVSFIMSHILSDNKAREMAFGPNSILIIPNKTVSVKTGTTDNKRDNWTIGYTPSFVVATWVGNNDNTPTSPQLTSGVTGAAPIWHKIMQELLKNKPDERPVQPESVVTKQCNGRTEYFIRGTENMGCTNTPTPTLSPFRLQ